MSYLTNLFYYTNSSILKLIFSPLYITSVLILYMLEYRKSTDFFIYLIYIIKYSTIGILISFIGMILGINIELNSRLLWLLPITLFAAIIDARYICLAYTGAIMGLYIDPLPIMGVVGLLHLTEGILLLCSFDFQVKKEIVYKDKKLKLAYMLEKMWIIPFSVFIARGLIVPIVVLIAFASRTRREYLDKKILAAGIGLLIYSLTLIFIYIYAQRIEYMKWVGLFVMPVMHEMMIRISED